jgi:signal transduction histidine kinase
VAQAGSAATLNAREGVAGYAAVPSSRRAPLAAWVSISVLALAGAVLTVLAWADLKPSDAVSNVSAAPSAMLYAALGSLIVRRAGNRIGWMLLVVSAGTAAMCFGSGYAVLGIVHRGTLPAPEIAGLLAEWSFIPVFIGFGFMLLLYPSGTLASRRWRPFAALSLLATVLAMIGLIVRPRLVALPAPGGASLRIANPLGVTSLGPIFSTVLIGTLDGLTVLGTVIMGAAMISLGVRYRSSEREARQQIKWIALTAVAAALLQVTALLAIAATNEASNPVTKIAYDAMPVLALFVVPAVIALAIFKHGLYQIDVIISRAVQYGLLSAVLTAVYAGIVVGIGTVAGYAGGPVLTIVAAVVIAVLFTPARHRAQRAANRLVYGERATPYQVLADFAEDMAGQLDAEAALDRMAVLLARATAATNVEVWVRVGAQLRLQAGWSPGSTTPMLPEPPRLPAVVHLTSAGELPAFGSATRVIAVRHSDELLGALTLSKPRNEQVSAAEDKLLTHLASEAGLVLRNVRLTAELQATVDDLRASRRRLVQAQDHERQRIERNLHDGAQQQLVAVSMQLSMLEAAEDLGEVRQISGELRSGLRMALDDLRALARGIYPPLLADQGLGAALRAQASRASVPVLIESADIGRYPRDVEAAVYFCVLEALQNVAKYAGASAAMVTISCDGGDLEFSVTDDGAGFDTTAVSYGTGLQGMADRLAAMGGRLCVSSAPGLGTTVTGSLPATHRDECKGAKVTIQ